MNILGIIAQVNFNDWDNPDYSETGGINSVIKNILPHLHADKIILYGFTYQKENLYKEKVIHQGLSVFPVFYISSTTLLPIRLFGFFHGWRLRKYLKLHNVKCIYSHAEELCFWLPHKKIPCIHHLHTFVNVLEVSGRRIAKIKLIQNLWEAVRTVSIKKSFRIVAVNKDVVNLVTKLIDKDRVIEFPNYVDEQHFKFTDSAELQEKLNLKNKKIALHIGRISQVKGLELFIDTIHELNQSEPPNWIGVIVGNGEYENQLRKYIASKALEEMIVFTGSINSTSELAKYYSMANVFLITSWSESVPLTLLESLSCGTPVISTDVGIAREVLYNSNGFVADSRNSKEFSKKIVLALELKSQKSLLPNKSHYSIEYAAGLLNTAIGFTKG